MNADGSRPVAVDLQAGIRSRFLAPVALGTLMTGLGLLVIGIALLLAARPASAGPPGPTTLPPVVRRRRHRRAICVAAPAGPRIRPG